MKCCDFEHFESRDDLERECLHILSKAEARRAQGAKEYGHDNFLHRDAFDDIEEELIDTINYCIFQIIKIRQTRKKLDQLVKETQAKIDMAGRAADVLGKFNKRPGGVMRIK